MEASEETQRAIVLTGNLRELLNGKAEADAEGGLIGAGTVPARESRRRITSLRAQDVTFVMARKCLFRSQHRHSPASLD